MERPGTRIALIATLFVIPVLVMVLGGLVGLAFAGGRRRLRA